jgi:hypothetical protein
MGLIDPQPRDAVQVSVIDVETKPRKDMDDTRNAAAEVLAR